MEDKRLQLKSFADLKPILDNFSKQMDGIREKQIPELEKRIKKMNEKKGWGTIIHEGIISALKL